VGPRAVLDAVVKRKIPSPHHVTLIEKWVSVANLVISKSYSVPALSAMFKSYCTEVNCRLYKDSVTPRV
jgi:hypothetical protein